MIVGSHRRDVDIEINVCKEKKLTNMRSETADAARRLNAIARFSLEEALEFVSEDELAGQAYRLPRAPRELLPAGHLALSLKDAVSLPDLGEITKRYRRGRRSRAYHIRMLLTLLLYAYRLVYGRFRRAQILVTAQ